MINYQDEIKHFKPSLDVDNIEDAIAGMNLTDMNDLMMQLVQNALRPEAAGSTYNGSNTSDDTNAAADADDGYVNEG